MSEAPPDAADAAELLGGPVTFVLSASGHIASMINSSASAAPGTYVHDR